MNIKLELPDSFFKEEERSGYVVSEEKKKLWAVELDLLNEFMRVCKKHNIRFFASDGTLLGVARHGGFIPWDDDLDIAMTREEYKKLDAVASEEFQYPYFWQNERTERDSTRGFAKLRNVTTTGIVSSQLPYKYTHCQGICIDVLPLDYVPEDDEERKVFLDKVRKLHHRMRNFSNHTTRWRDLRKYRGWKRAKRWIYHLYLTKIVRAKENPLYDELEKMRQSYNAVPTKKLGEICCHFFEERFMWDADWFSTTIEMPFENLLIPVSVDYDKILTKEYGDWRTPSQEPGCHAEIFFDVEKPYTEYIK